MTIRRFAEADARAVSALIIHTMRVSNAADYPADMLEALIQHQRPEDVLTRAGWTHFYVAEDAGEIIGCGAIGPYWDRQDESSLFTVFVLPERQGQGVGRAIVEALEADEYALRARRIEVPASITGLPFYRRMGYEYKNGVVKLDDERLYRLEKFRRAGEASRSEALSPEAALRLILNRRSYRGRYMAKPVPREDLRAIMEAGLAAPSGCNKQTTSLVAVDDPELLSGIRAVIDPPVAESAPAMICVLTRRVNAYRDRCFAVQDYSAAIENMLLMITALGYQSCWYEGHITDTDRIGDKIARVLEIPEGFELVCILPVGVAESEPRPPKKLPFEVRAWFNTTPFLKRNVESDGR